MPDCAHMRRDIARDSVRDARILRRHAARASRYAQCAMMVEAPRDMRYVRKTLLSTLVIQSVRAMFVHGEGKGRGRSAEPRRVYAAGAARAGGRTMAVERTVQCAAVSDKPGQAGAEPAGSRW